MARVRTMHEEIRIRGGRPGLQASPSVAFIRQCRAFRRGEARMIRFSGSVRQFRWLLALVRQAMAA